MQVLNKAMKMKIIIGSDHAGYEMKEYLKTRFAAEYDWHDAGAYSAESVDYPDFAHPVATAVAEGKFAKGVLICGTGNGVAMTANKHNGVRAALCWNVEIAKLARQHNDANIIVLPARFISNELAAEIIEAFFKTEFEGGRHVRRIGKINL